VREGWSAVLVALCFGAAVTACDWGGGEEITATGTSSGERTSTTGSKLAIESSLQGVAVLPNHIRWVATSSLPTAQIREVRFLVDGELSWVDRDPPYMYGGDGSYLVTTTLWTSGRAHRFTTGVVAKDGSRANLTVRARVRKPRNWWGGIVVRRITPADREKSGLPAGKRYWTLVFYPGELLVAWPDTETNELRAHAYEYSVVGRTLHIYAPIHRTPEGVYFTAVGYTIGGYHCRPGGPFASYRWSGFRARANLFGRPQREYFVRLMAKHEPCAARRAVLEGAWVAVD
jgi:hypothetical protein